MLDFIQSVLEKAKKEGKINPQLLPWEVWNSDPAVDRKVEHHQPRSLQNVPDGMFNEAKLIVENILALAKGKKLQVIGFSSPLSQAGTSTLISVISYIAATRTDARQANSNGNVGIEFSSQGSGILLIDAQLQHPSLHNKFGVKNERGLVDLLFQQNYLNSATEKVTANLDLVTMGQDSWDPRNQIEIEKFESILEEARREYKFVFLDLPPVLQCAEGSMLSRLCDGIILIIEAGQTQWEALEDTQELLEEAEVNVLGAVLNKKTEPIPESIHRII